MAKLLPKRMKVKPGSSPDRTHIKVDFETVLKRRGRRTALDYIKSITGITTKKDLKHHLDMLSKTYVLSPSFIETCEQHVAASGREKKEHNKKGNKNKNKGNKNKNKDGARKKGDGAQRNRKIN